MVTRAEKRRAVAQILRDANDDSANLDATLLTAFAEGVSPNDVRLNGDVSVKNEAFLDHCVERRLKHEPVAKIVGKKGFWKSEFVVNADVLDPRPDSETLIDAVSTVFVDKTAPLTFLDLGTGSGCLVLSLLGEYPNATGTGVDISEKALAVASENARRLGLSDRFKTVFSDWNDDGFCSLFEQKADVVICNPPYIAESEILSADTLFDPKTALFASENGLAAYRVLSEKLSFLLKADGRAFFEVGAGQAAAVSALFLKNGFTTDAVQKDFGGIERCLILSAVKKSG